jgi:hypothetical protein
MPIQLNPTSSFPPSGWNTGVKPTAKPVTPAPSPVTPDLSLTREWKPTPEQFKVDQLHLQRFDLKDTLMTAQYNYDAVLANPKSTKTDIKQAGDDLRKAKSSVDKFEKKNPQFKTASDLKDTLMSAQYNYDAVRAKPYSTKTDIMQAGYDLRKAESNVEEFEKKNPLFKTASFELDALISQYTKGGFNIPTKIKNAARDMIGGFWDGVYPSKNSIKAMLTKLSDAASKPEPEPKLPLKWPDLNNVYKMVIGTYDTIQDEYGNQFKLEGFERLGPDGKIIQAKGLGPLPKLSTIG